MNDERGIPQDGVPPTPGTGIDSAKEEIVPMNQPQGRMVPFVMVTVLGLVAVVPVFSLVVLPFYNIEPPDELVAMGSLAIGALARDFKRIMTGSD